MKKKHQLYGLHYNYILHELMTHFDMSYELPDSSAALAGEAEMYVKEYNNIVEPDLSQGLGIVAMDKDKYT